MKTIVCLRTATMIGGIPVLILAAGCSDGGGGYWNRPYGQNKGYNGGYNSSYSSYGISYPYSGHDNGQCYPQNYGKNSYNPSYRNGYQNGVRANENRDRRQGNNTVLIRERSEGRGTQHANVDDDKYSRKDYKHSEKN